MLPILLMLGFFIISSLIKFTTLGISVFMFLFLISVIREIIISDQKRRGKNELSN